MRCFPENWPHDVLLFILNLAFLRPCAVIGTASSLKTASNKTRETNAALIGRPPSFDSESNVR
jgi:hypothetical protein